MHWQPQPIPLVGAVLLLFATGCSDPIGFSDPGICLLPPDVRLELACSTEPLPVAGDPGFVALALGRDHTCALTAEGQPHCWGALAEPGGHRLVVTSPVPVAGIMLVSIAAGSMHTCGLTAGGEAWCWGANYSGQLGTGDSGSAAAPVRVATDVRFTRIRGGVDHTCALDTAGSAWCWGMDWYGEVGRGVWDMRGHGAPLRVVGEHTFASLELGQRATCALKPDGEAWCWGFGHSGQLGTLSAERCSDFFMNALCATYPVPVATPLRFHALVSGTTHSCASTHDGEIYCWGDPGQGQLGPAYAAGLGFTPLQVPTLRLALLAAGGSTNCGVRADGDAVCWGGNWWGQLGTGSRKYQNEHVAPVLGGHRFQTLEVGHVHTCGITDAGRTLCWGSNEYGQLGTGRH